MYLIYKHPIRLNMTFTEVAIVPGQQMVAIFSIKRFAVCKGSDDTFDFVKIISSLLCKLQVLLELTGRNNFIFHLKCPPSYCPHRHIFYIYPGNEEFPSPLSLLQGLFDLEHLW